MKRKITTIDEYGLHVYGPNKDGRIRAWDPETGRVSQYCRLLMEKILGRRLERWEDVHHIDEDPNNNDSSNLEVIDHRKHTSKHAIEQKERNGWKDENDFQDKEMICPICGNKFIWTAHQQWERYHNYSRKDKENPYNPFCSKQCIGKNNCQYGINNNGKKILMCDKNNHEKILKEFNSQKEASQYTKIGTSSICRYLQGTQNCSKYYWKYAE